MTSWINLLLTTVRLLDLHDSGHERNSPHVRVQQEQRPGARDGYWLDLACLLLDYLLEEDYLTNSAYIPQSRCWSHLREFYPELSRDDLAYVINMLATPSELHFINRRAADYQPGQVARTKRTALIEKQPQTQHVRLTASGRHAVNLAGQVEDLLYSEYDAAKVLAAISRGDFARVPEICNSILLAIRSLTQDIRRIRENPTREGKLQAFRENQRHYHNALNSIQRTLMDCRSQLTQPGKQQQFEAWAERQTPPWDLLMLTQSLNRVLNAIENLSRRLTELLTDIAEGRIQSMGVVDFAAAAQRLAHRPPAPALFEQVFLRCAPFSLNVCYPSPEDFGGLIKEQKSEHSIRPLVFDANHDPSPEDTALQQFLAVRGPTLRAHLEQQPLPLFSALDNGWHLINDEDYLPQLLNMYVDTHQLAPDLIVAIDATAELQEYVLPDGRVLTGDNPVLRKKTA